MVGINEGMCVVYFKLCFMIGYVVRWCTFMFFNNNNITWCHKLSVFTFIAKLYSIITSIYNHIEIIIVIFNK